jgi:hypothetical protein
VLDAGIQSGCEAHVGAAFADPVEYVRLESDAVVGKEREVFDGVEPRGDRVADR